jgi:putative DNA primase/helicase
VSATIPQGGALPLPSGSADMLGAALTYAGAGWPVFPCVPGGKTPLTQHGCLDATTNEAQIRRWWDRWPGANVAIATGAESGLVVLDPDRDKGGLESLADLQLERGPLPAGPVVRTGGGGEHLYFRHPGGKIANKVELRPGLDVRGDGGYVVAPPSRHASGNEYKWVALDAEPPEAPLWLLDLLREGGGQRSANVAKVREGEPIGEGRATAWFSPTRARCAGTVRVRQ